MNINIENQIKEIIKAHGENLEREGLKGTPKRVSSAYNFLLSGYKKDIKKIINGAIYKKSSNGLIILKDIEFFSLCEHHLMPFFGKCHIGYFPKNKIIGISKIPRIIDVFARRLQIQEKLTDDIATAINDYIDPFGVIVVIQAQHLCVMMRGVEKQNANLITSSIRGCFHTDESIKSNFFKQISIMG